MSDTKHPEKREHWGTRIGLILAMAGNAVGLGNFLRFPAKAAANGGGAFMIPYFIAFLILGIPLMWLEWAIGRYGGTIGHGTMPGVLHKIFHKKWVKYLGVFGVALPLLVAGYYCYIESWTLAYSWFSITGSYTKIGSQNLNEGKKEMGRFLREFQGIPPTVKVPISTPREQIQKISEFVEPDQVPQEMIYKPELNNLSEKSEPCLANELPYRNVPLKGKYFESNSTAYIFFLITFTLNVYFMYRGLSAGIEQLGKIGMPILFGFAVVLAVRVLTLGHPEGSQWSIADGFNFLWIPKFEELKSASVWLAAAGQIFFTLSLGMGTIQAYASYLSSKDDIVLTGLSTASLNEFAEVVLGGTIAVPTAVAFFGPEMTVEIAKGGTFDLGFQALPMIFSKIGMGWFFGAIWFILLFIAGITSSVALLTPAVTFMKDEMKFSHEKAVFIACGICFLVSHATIFFLADGVLDEIDYWGGTFGLVAFALLEIIAFVWVFGAENAWKEMHKGCEMKIPRFFMFILKYITPLYILFIFFFWGIQDGWPILIMANVQPSSRVVIWWTRFMMWAIIGLFIYFIWLRFKDEDNESYLVPLGLWGIPFLILLASYPGLLPINTNALLMIVTAWSITIGLSTFCIYQLLFRPNKKHYENFPDEVH